MSRRILSCTRFPAKQQPKYPTIPLVLLHGLFGTKSNLRSIGYDESINDKRTCYLFDLRNHGDSFHDDIMTIKDMAEDVIWTLQSYGEHETIWLGHSLGGRIAMSASLNYSNYIIGMIIADISPNDVSSRPDNNLRVIECLKNLDNYDVKDRNDAISILMNMDLVKEIGLNLFEIQWLLSTYIKSSNENDGKYKFKMNLDSMYNNMDNIVRFMDDHKGLKYDGPTRFIFGENSEYYNINRDKSIINEYFPDNKINVINNVGHLLHIQKPNEFKLLVKDMLQDIDPLPNE